MSAGWLKVLEGSQLDNLHLDRMLGSGGDGAVFSARRKVLDQFSAPRKVRGQFVWAPLAVTVMVLDEDGDRTMRLRREIAAGSTLMDQYLAGISYPREATVRIGSGHQALLYFTMSLAMGSLLDEVRKPDRMPLDRAERIVGRLAWTLEYLHGHRDGPYVHRDVKPGNVLRYWEGYKLCNYVVLRLEASGSISDASAKIETLRYMPPEGVEGVSEQMGGHPSWDMWSLGMVGLELATGAHPFEGLSTGPVLDRLLRWDEGKIPPVEGWLGPVIRGCLKRDPSKRWTAERVVEALEDAGSRGGGMVTGGVGPSAVVGVAEVGAGRVFRDREEAWCPEMVVVPGTAECGLSEGFWMGSPATEEGRNDAESPRHRVRVPRFALGVHAVTRGQWGAFVAATGYTSKGTYVWTGSEFKYDASRDWRDPGFRQGDDHPVVCVSWEDAQAYIGWLSEKTGCVYRLPSESEWEWACRADVSGCLEDPFSFGETISTDQANYDGRITYGGGKKGIFRGGTVAVDAFAANGFGVHQMHGNVWEWCQDRWLGTYEVLPTDGSAWEESDEYGHRISRGGSWNLDPLYARSAARSAGWPGLRDAISGFRLARTLTP